MQLKQDVHILLNPVMLLFVKQLFIHNLKKCPKKDFLKSTAECQVSQPYVLQD